MSPALPRPARASRTTLFMSALVAALLCFVVSSVSMPGEVLGATSAKTAMCSANLRTIATTSGRVRATIKKGTKVSVVATVTGGSWRTTCAGKPVHGRSWLRISAINGRSVRSIFGVRYMYAAAGLFKPVVYSYTRYAACSVYLRTGPDQTTAAKALIKVDVPVTIVASVAGTAYNTTCAGQPAVGTGWYRISAVNGKSVSSLYGVSYVYAMGVLFKTTVTTTAVLTPAGTKTVNVSSVAALMTALADNTVDVIVVANGTYHISHAGNQASDSLWIGSRYAGRTRAVTVRAATIGGVTFDGGGGALGGISFNGGAHDQTWDGFHFANGVTGQTGVVMFGGYSGMAAPYNIALKHITIDASCHRVYSGATDHAMYFSYALDGWRNILVEDFTVNATDTMGLASAIHMDHGYASDAPNVAAHGVTVRRLVFNGNKGIPSQQAILLWQPPTRDWLFDGATITNAGSSAIRYESTATNIVFKDITSVNSGGFYSSQGANPAGVTFINDVLH
jgi:hypothetical protein